MKESRDTTSAAAEGEVIRHLHLETATEEEPVITKGTEFSAVHNLSKREMDMIRAGGLLAYTAQQHG